ncbi:hypothetical protein D3C76_1704250 [compost metagenome]
MIGGVHRVIDDVLARPHALAADDYVVMAHGCRLHGVQGEAAKGQGQQAGNQRGFDRSAFHGDDPFVENRPGVSVRA